MGRIGRYVANHMQHFGMKVIYTKRLRLPVEGSFRFPSSIFLFSSNATADLVEIGFPQKKTGANIELWSNSSPNRT